MTSKTIAQEIQQIYSNPARGDAFLSALYLKFSMLAKIKLRGILKKNRYYMSSGEVEEKAHDVASTLILRHMRNPAYEVKRPAVIVYLDAINALYDRKIVKYESALVELDEDLSSETIEQQEDQMDGSKVAHLAEMIEAAGCLEDAYCLVAHRDPELLRRYYRQIAEMHAARARHVGTAEVGIVQIEFDFAV